MQKSEKNQKNSWQTLVKDFQKTSLVRSWIQVADTFLPYILLWGLMYLSLSVSYILTLLLAIPMAGLLIRLFIIFHDCGHGSFFKTVRANDIMGILTGIVLITPYYEWRHDHAVHHACAGNLDKRGIGDIWTMTVKEYLAASRWTRFKYRVYRNPFIFFLFGPFLLFLCLHRIPRKNSGRRERRSVHFTNVAVLGVVVLMSYWIGLKTFLMIQMPILFVMSVVGVWMFYVQHQFEDVYWESSKNWDYARVAFEGSSFYRLPKILQWFTGNIGFHHIHHLSPRIPNYYLQRCHESHTMFRDVKGLSLRESVKSLGYRLWDEQQRRMVGFDAIKRLRMQEAHT